MRIIQTALCIALLLVSVSAIAGKKKFDLASFQESARRFTRSMQPAQIAPECATLAALGTEVGTNCPWIDGSKQEDGGKFYAGERPTLGEIKTYFNDKCTSACVTSITNFFNNLVKCPIAFGYGEDQIDPKHVQDIVYYSASCTERDGDKCGNYIYATESLEFHSCEKSKGWEACDAQPSCKYDEDWKSCSYVPSSDWLGKACGGCTTLLKKRVTKITGALLRVIEAKYQSTVIEWKKSQLSPAKAWCIKHNGAYCMNTVTTIEKANRQAKKAAAAKSTEVNEEGKKSDSTKVSEEGKKSEGKGTYTKLPVASEMKIENFGDETVNVDKMCGSSSGAVCARKLINGMVANEEQNLREHKENGLKMGFTVKQFESNKDVKNTRSWMRRVRNGIKNFCKRDGSNYCMQKIYDMTGTNDLKFHQCAAVLDQCDETWVKDECAGYLVQWVKNLGCCAETFQHMLVDGETRAEYKESKGSSPYGMEILVDKCGVDPTETKTALATKCQKAKSDKQKLKLKGVKCALIQDSAKKEKLLGALRTDLAEQLEVDPQDIEELTATCGSTTDSRRRATAESVDTEFVIASENPADVSSAVSTMNTKLKASTLDLSSVSVTVDTECSDCNVEVEELEGTSNGAAGVSHVTALLLLAAALFTIF